MKQPTPTRGYISAADRAWIIRKHFPALDAYFHEGQWHVPSQSSRSVSYAQRAILRADGTFQRLCPCASRTLCVHYILTASRAGNEPTEGEVVWDERAFEDRWAHLMKPERKAS